jgi:hypothetical protein
MVEAGGPPGFTHDPVSVVSLRPVVPKGLDRDVAFQPRVVGAIDDAHAPFTEHANDVIPAESIARREH